ncbi:DUF6538 domain-containing protein [Roseovarius sp. A-2]|uniref:DUF6538 domain-containing protein n=1 Tax=Roseovarius sp. A-2 TaxID=1570360 RepID=UPI001594274E|nr:DUF6538 domain-containing protein [Roseovarius sp. A-2]
MAGLAKRGDTWHLRMRVPRRYASVEKRKELHRSLKTGDKKEAQGRLAAVESQILAELDAKLVGMDTPGTRSHYEAIARLTTARGFGYRTAQELADGDLGDILRRVDALKASGDAPTEDAAQALLGGVERPRETLGEIAERMPEMFPAEVRDKNARQRSTWEKRWTRPAGKVTELLGRDPALEDISRSDAVSLRDALQDRILEGSMKGASAQKDLQNLNLLWKKYHQHLGVDLAEMPPSPFRGLGDGMSRLDEDSRKPEVPLDVIEQILLPDAMEHMNDEEADITRVLVETGARQSEITDLPPGSICIDHPIPHVWIRFERAPDGEEYARELKNKATKRQIPLVGVALAAMKRHPNGFPRYRGKGTYSAAANKSLRRYLPDGVTIGGLRHSFETRLKNAGVDSDDRAELMGHSVRRARGREWYGDSMPLEKRLEYHEKIAIKPRRALPAP